MNAQIEELLARGKAEKLRKRNAHLIKLGLVDTSKGPHRECGNGEAVPIEVTDEEYEEICKLFPEEKGGRTTDSKAPETALKSIASILLVIGILTFVVCLIAFIRDTPGLDIVYGFILLVASFVSWALLRCIADISSTLKDIKSKINSL